MSIIARGLGYATPGSTVYDPVSNTTIFGYGTLNAVEVPGNQTGAGAPAPLAAPNQYGAYYQSANPGSIIMGSGVYTPVQTSLPIGGPMASGPQPAAAAPPTQGGGPAPVAQPGAPAAPPQGPPIVVQTPTGPVTIPASEIPPTTDAAMGPVAVHIPNVWDSLDPSKASQFEYVGPAISMPQWISRQYLDSIRPPAAPVGDGAAVAMLSNVAGAPMWVWLALLAVLFLLSQVNRSSTSRAPRAPRRRKRSTVAHG